MLSAALVLVNGNIITINSQRPEAKAVAIKHGRFVAVGTNKQILSYADKHTKKIDLKCKTVVPGFIDTHVHGASLGRGSSQIDLRHVKSISDIQREVKQWTKKVSRGRWIIGRGWSQDQLVEHRFPSCLDLDQAAPSNPVLLLRVCGHLGVVNSKAMKLAGITKQTELPQGAGIDRDTETGTPDGILREKALSLVYDILPESSEESLTKACLLACQRMVEEGITTAHWITSSTKELRALQKLNDCNMLPLRVYLLILAEHLDNLIELGIQTGFGDHKIRVGSVKIMADGSLGARSAALKQPYEDAAETKGMLLYSQKQLEKFVKKAHAANIQLAIHAIGDRTIEMVLKIFKRVLEKMPRENHRHRLEHVSVLNRKLIRRMKEIGVIASVQPHFVVSDFWLIDRLGKTRARWAYAFKSLLKAGVITMGGSDAPVEPVSPLLGISAAVARNTFSQERLTIEEALRLYTMNAAHGSFEEEEKGSIEKGKLADLVVLSKDPCKVAPEQIKNIKVEMTIVGGNIVYARKP